VQVRGVVTRLIEAGHWRDGDPEIPNPWASSRRAPPQPVPPLLWGGAAAAGPRRWWIRRAGPLGRADRLPAPGA